MLETLTIILFQYGQCSPENNRSEGFSRTGYLVPARGSPGVSSDGEGSWDAVTWKFRSTFWLGNYIWSLSLWNWTQMGHLGTSVPGFCTEFRYLLYGHSGFAWGAIWGKIIKNQENALFENMDMSKNSKNVNFPKKSRRRPTSTRQPEAFKNTGSLWNLPFFTESWKSDFFQKRSILMKRIRSNSRNDET